MFSCASTPKKSDKPIEPTDKPSSKEEKADLVREVKIPEGWPFYATGPVARFHGGEISADSFNKAVEPLPPIMANFPQGNRLGTIKERIINELIVKKIMEIVVDSRKDNVSKKDVDMEFSKFEDQLSKQPGGVQGFYERTLKTESEIKEDIRKGIALKAMLIQSYDVKVSDAEVKTFYDDHKARYEEKSQVRAMHILFKADGKDKVKLAAAKKKADEAYKAAKKKGVDFGELAKKISEGPSAINGGDLGFFSKDRMVPEFSEAAFKGKKNQILKPFKTHFGFHVIKVVDKKAAQSVPFSEVKEGIHEQLEKPKMMAAFREFLKAQKLKLKFEILAKNVIDNPKFNSKPIQTP